jgi:hypothetical protein
MEEVDAALYGCTRDSDESQYFSVTKKHWRSPLPMVVLDAPARKKTQPAKATHLKAEHF